MSVHAKLMQARMRLHGTEIRKSGRNTFANYNYMELGDFLIPTQTIFAELGLCGVVSFTADIASLTITDVEDGTTLVITSPMGSAALKGCHEVQNIGAVETYQRRYLWMAALEIVEHDAIDSAEPVKPAPKVVAQAMGTDNPKRDAFNALQPEVQDSLRKTAAKVTGAMPDVQVAIEMIHADLDEWQDQDTQELKKGLWYLLDSGTRSAIDKVQKTRKQNA